MIEPLRYQFDDLDKQVRRKPVGIDLIATMEILHRNLARIEQELALMRERVDMELLLRNDSLSDENLPLPGDTPPSEEDPPGQARDGQTEPIGGIIDQPRAFAAAGDPFEIPPSSDAHETRTDNRAGDETLILKPVKLTKIPSGDQHRLPPATTQAKHASGDEHRVDASDGRKARSVDGTKESANAGSKNRKPGLNDDDTLVLERPEPPAN